MTVRSIVILFLALAGCSRLGGGGTEFLRLIDADKHRPIGDQHDCFDCHLKIRDFHEASIHRRVMDCESCHGPGGEHAEDPPGAIIGPAALRNLSPQGRSEMCLRCHRNNAAAWPATAHARAGLACFTCHSDAVHFKQPEAVRPPREFPSSTPFCEQCHAAAVAELNQPYHHPVREGEISCTSCHDIHGEFERATATWDYGVCARCHPRQTHEKVFRHPALDEGCGVCHAPHGSSIPSLLTRTANSLCLQCHFQPGFPNIAGVDHAVFLARAANCWDCHVDVHGSNSDPSLLGRIR